MKYKSDECVRCGSQVGVRGALFCDRCALPPVAPRDIRAAAPPGEVAELRRQLADLQRQLAEVTGERDHLVLALKLADALRNQQFISGKVDVLRGLDGAPVVTWTSEHPPCAHFAGQKKA